MAFTPTPYAYGGYPGPGGYYAPPMPDNLATLRQGGNFQQPAMAQPMQQPVQQVPAVQQGQPANNGILWCQGEEGAKAWLVGAGSTVMLMDSDGSSFYLKSADASGMPLPLRIFDYKERTAQKQATDAPQAPEVDYVPRADFDALAARCEAIEAELTALRNKPCKCSEKKTKEEK